MHGVPAANLASLEVVLTERIQTEEEYSAKLKDHSDAVAKFEKDLYTNFITSRLVVIVADTDDSAAGAKLAKVPMMQEKKRKLFLYQEDLNAKIDIDKVKKRKISKYAPVSYTHLTLPTIRSV